MDNQTEKFSIFRFDEKGSGNAEGVVAREFPLTIVLNDQELVTLLCFPTDLTYLTVGFLFSEGLLKAKDEIKNILVDGERGVVRVETIDDKAVSQDILFKRFISSGCGRGASFYSSADATSQKVESQMEMSAAEVLDLAKRFQRSSSVYLATHGVHSAALCDRQTILVFSEDIGRHNAIDKIFGRCILEDISTEGRAVITTGRVSSEILHKVAKRGIPIIISISAPTNLGVRIADTLNITLVTSVRGKSMNVYTAPRRIIHDGR
ncbi:MAG: formate dehydrogenase accessory sulfurtransferase FdhD [Dehalococcoidia bacterium]